MKYIKGNLLDTECKIIAHGCNAQGVFNAGIAKQIRQKFPYAYNSYINSELKPGKVLISYPEKEELPIIANCITQEFYGYNNKCYVDYDAIKYCMESLNSFCIKYKINEIAMPKIGSGLGGGDWDIIEKIIEQSFEKYITIIIYYNDK